MNATMSFHWKILILIANKYPSIECSWLCEQLDPTETDFYNYFVESLEWLGLGWVGLAVASYYI